MAILLNTLLILVSVALITLILVQTRGGTGNLFGPAEGSYRSRRGIESIIFRATIALGVIFLAVAILIVFFSG